MIDCLRITFGIARVPDTMNHCYINPEALFNNSDLKGCHIVSKKKYVYPRNKIFINEKIAKKLQREFIATIPIDIIKDEPTETLKAIFGSLDDVKGVKLVLDKNSSRLGLLEEFGNKQVSIGRIVRKVKEES